MDIESVFEFVKPRGADDRLLPCPFCGNNEIVYAHYKHVAGDRWAVLCTACMAEIDPGYAQQKSEAAKQWNRRQSREYTNPREYTNLVEKWKM